MKTKRKIFYPRQKSFKCVWSINLFLRTITINVRREPYGIVITINVRREPYGITITIFKCQWGQKEKVFILAKKVSIAFGVLFL